jgi:carboxyl-terminal processing protease
VTAAVKLIHGRPGEAVVLGVKHAGSDDIQQITVVRDVVRLPSIQGDRYTPDHGWEFMLDDQKKIGYVRLTEVGRQSVSEMREALGELMDRGMKRLVLDLRSNPGGLMEGSVGIANLFVDSGTIVRIKGRSGGEEVIKAKAVNTLPGFPMAVLVNQNTTSAAEIIAACLQDHERAVIIGQRTHGEGLVKQLIHVNGGKNALKLPTAAYYRPSGKNMHHYPELTEMDDWGVRPDDGYEVIVDETELKEWQEYRRQRGIVNGVVDTNYRDRPLEKALEFLAEK